MKPKYIFSLIVLLGLLLYLQFNSNEIQGTSYSYRDSGFRATFFLLRELNIKTSLWRKSFKDLPTKGRRDVLIIAYAQGLAHVDNLVKWVESGNILVLLGNSKFESSASYKFILPAIDEPDFYNILIQNTKDRALDKQDENKSTLTCADEIKEICEGVNFISPSLLNFKTINKEYNYSYDQNNKAILTYKKQGAGEVFYFADGRFALNKDIDKFDNLNLLYQVISRGNRVFFDEFHHGYHEPVSTRLKTRQDALIILSVVFIAVLVMAVISRSKRFGQVVILNNENDAKQSDFVAALGLLYKEHRVVEILKYYANCWKHRAAKKFSISMNKDDQTFIDSLIISGAITESSKSQFAKALNVLSESRSSVDNLEIERNIHLLESIT